MLNSLLIRKPFRYICIIKRNDMIHTIINLRGQREQAFIFALKRNGKKQKSCFTRGCEIFVPIAHAIKGVDLSDAIVYENKKASILGY